MMEQLEDETGHSWVRIGRATIETEHFWCQNCGCLKICRYNVGVAEPYKVEYVKPRLEGGIIAVYLDETGQFTTCNHD